MKKLIYVTALFVISLTANAQCGERATLVTTECGSTCLSVQMEFTGILSVDLSLLVNSGGTMERKPSISEVIYFAENEEC